MGRKARRARAAEKTGGGARTDALTGGGAGHLLPMYAS